MKFLEDISKYGKQAIELTNQQARKLGGKIGAKHKRLQN